MVDDDNVAVATGQLAKDLTRVVRAGVVDEDDLAINGELREELLQPFVHMRYGLCVAVARDDRAQLFTASRLLGIHNDSPS